MPLRVLHDYKSLKGKRVLLRADFNVPVNRGKIGAEEDWRLRRVVPTIEKLRKAGARIVLATHMGRPEGKKVASLKVDAVAKRLSQLAHAPIEKLSDCLGSEVEEAVAAMKDGDIVMLENLRFRKGEEENDLKFAEALSRLADVYLDEAFGVSHRAAASNVGITRYLPSYAGPLFEAEVDALTKALEAPERPYLVVMGGAKVSSKIGVISQMLSVADRVLLGGALIAPFYKAMSHCIGVTACSDEDLEAARKLMEHPYYKKLILPHDVVIGDPKNPGGKPTIVDLQEKPFDLCRDHEAILDIGPKTISAYASYIRSAKMIVWNGPLGWFEQPKFSHGTLALGRLIAARSKGRAFGVVGGGETVQALARTGLMDCVDHVSTGGGAMLEFLEGKVLPGIQPLLDASK
ncbi:MAG TPA: phosphoglycerate kinase [Candidatus Baltobacteraceae bacterium]|nr:phosphoglycerate kinase [Candidatus Baltobacteraceae bacterium]